MVFAEVPFENRLSSDSKLFILKTFYWTVKKELYVK